MSAGDGARSATDDTVEAALSRAALHARRAAVEALEAVRALLDVAALLSQGVPAESHMALAGAAAWLARIADGLSPDAGGEAALTRALADALDAEIARWEARARQDPDARAVLRAFLGLRELLWELGVRGAAPDASDAPDSPDEAPPHAGGRSRASSKGSARRRRVERVPVQG